MSNLIKMKIQSGISSPDHLNSTAVVMQRQSRPSPSPVSTSTRRYCHGYTRKKKTTDTSVDIRFTAHQQEAWHFFFSHKILNPDQFDLVDWETVNHMLHRVPKLFQLFACKQVFGISAFFFPKSISPKAVLVPHPLLPVLHNCNQRLCTCLNMP
jgi:hypothetical protein